MSQLDSSEQATSSAAAAAATLPDAAGLFLLCGVGATHFAIRVGDVVETMRPLAIRPLAAPPPFLLGLSIIRGAPVPVVDLGALLGAPDAVPPARFVLVRAGTRVVALAVAQVFGVRPLPQAALAEPPPLVRGGAPESLASLGAVDGELLVVLQAARLLPPSTWAALRSTEAEPRW